MEGIIKYVCGEISDAVKLLDSVQFTKKDDEVAVELFKNVAKTEHIDLQHILNQLEYLRDRFVFGFILRYGDNENMISFNERMLALRNYLSNEIYGVL
jgi:hypothetical protein